MQISNVQIRRPSAMPTRGLQAGALTHAAAIAAGAAVSGRVGRGRAKMVVGRSELRQKLRRGAATQRTNMRNARDSIQVQHSWYNKSDKHPPQSAAVRSNNTPGRHAPQDVQR